jgi:hypothetical protein
VRKHWKKAWPQTPETDVSSFRVQSAIHFASVERHTAVLLAGAAGSLSVGDHPYEVAELPFTARTKLMRR